jgi:hypothetical protein
MTVTDARSPSTEQPHTIDEAKLNAFISKAVDDWSAQLGWLVLQPPCGRAAA